MKKIRVVELFAGVGGFHIGFKNANEKLGLADDSGFKVEWANQWEPSTKKQHAFEVYKFHFSKSVNEYSCEDIHKVVEEHFDQIPEHDLLVGGFPCQDYSVARTLTQAKGIEGKKGVLWWDIKNILEKSGTKSPKYLMLENVDRLLKSPASQRGRDFAIMLVTLAKLGYAVEWRVVNAADYGMPQRRRRTYILGYKKGTSLYSKLKSSDPVDWVNKHGIFAKSFPIIGISSAGINSFELDKDLVKITSDFNKGGNRSLFETSGIMLENKVYTAKIAPKYSGDRVVLSDLVEEDESQIPSEYFIDESSLQNWKDLKGAKKEVRVTKDGFKYNYSEGGMIFPDKLNGPSRTIVTGEGGASPSRFKHVIETKSGKLRRLMPIELEKLNMFPENHTSFEPSAVKRAFFMGNALVTGIVTKLAITIYGEADD